MCKVLRAYCMTQFSFKQLCRVPWWSAGKIYFDYRPLVSGWYQPYSNPSLLLEDLFQETMQVTVPKNMANIDHLYDGDEMHNIFEASALERSPILIALHHIFQIVAWKMHYNEYKFHMQHWSNSSPNSLFYGTVFFFYIYFSILSIGPWNNWCTWYCPQVYFLSGWKICNYSLRTVVSKVAVKW